MHNRKANTNITQKADKNNPISYRYLPIFLNINPPYLNNIKTL